MDDGVRLSRTTFEVGEPVRVLWLTTVLVTVSVQTLHIYKAQNRPAAELVPIAESAMGADGVVTLDARTASLILNGSTAAIDRALRMLERMDRPLRQIVITQETRQAAETDALFARVSWKASLGPLRIGTLPGPGPGISASFTAEARRERRSSTTRSTLRLTEGSRGEIVTGRALPILFEPYWGGTSYASVTTGFEVTAHVLGSDARPIVQLELRPFAGRVDESGALNYIAASTSLPVGPGETLVLGRVVREEDAREVALTGVEADSERVEELLLVRVELDP